MWVPLMEAPVGSLINYKVGHKPYHILGRSEEGTLLVTPQNGIQLVTDDSYVYVRNCKRNTTIELVNPSTGIQHMFLPHTNISLCGVSVLNMISGTGVKCQRCYHGR